MRPMGAIMLLWLCATPALASPGEETRAKLGAGDVSLTGVQLPAQGRPEFQRAIARQRAGDGQPRASGRYAAGPHPAKWCGWWMRTQFGGGPQYNRARLWAHRGVNAGGPRVGAVVVWKHHVGLITGRAENGRWIVKSGNDSNRVRERARSLHGAIAFRMLG